MRLFCFFAHQHKAAEAWTKVSYSPQVNGPKAWWNMFFGEMISNNPVASSLQCKLNWPQIVCHSSHSLWGTQWHGLLIVLPSTLTRGEQRLVQSFLRLNLSAWIHIMMCQPSDAPKMFLAVALNSFIASTHPGLLRPGPSGDMAPTRWTSSWGL